MEFKRNRERTSFLKWGTASFQDFPTHPAGIGIVHQEIGVPGQRRSLRSINYQESTITIYFPDTWSALIRTRTMINVSASWAGASADRAEAGMLGQPVYF